MEQNPYEFSRQVEILASCMNDVKLSKADYAFMYGVQEITINRDLGALKKRGIQIGSRKGKVVLDAVPDQELLIDFASNYLPFKLNSLFFHNKVRALAESNCHNYFQLLTFLSKAVRENLKVELKYDSYGRGPDNYSVTPVHLSFDGSSWVLNAIAEDDDKLKTFYLNRIVQADLVYSYKICEMAMACPYFAPDHDIVLRFDDLSEDDVYERIWFENYQLSTDEEDRVILKTRQQITDELASWCIAWRDSLEVLEPAELKEHIYNMMDSFRMKNPRS